MGLNDNTKSVELHDRRSIAMRAAIENFCSFMSNLAGKREIPRQRNFGGYPFVYVDLEESHILRFFDSRTKESISYDVSKHVQLLPDEYFNYKHDLDRALASIDYTLLAAIKLTKFRNKGLPINKVYHFRDFRLKPISAFTLTNQGPNGGLYPIRVQELMNNCNVNISGKYILVFQRKRRFEYVYYFGPNQYRIDRCRRRNQRRSGRRNKMEKSVTRQKGFHIDL